MASSVEHWNTWDDSFVCEYARGKYSWVLMPSFICVHFSQLVDHFVTQAYVPHNTLEDTHAKILVSTLEHQLSQGDTNGEVVDHQCNLACTSI